MFKLLLKQSGFFSILASKQNRMKRNIILGLGILLASCAASKIVMTDTESTNYKYGKTKFTGYTKEVFMQGKTIDASSCGRCHKLKNPANFTEEQLNKIIPNMAKKAKLSDADKDVVLKYYIASGKHS